LFILIYLYLMTFFGIGFIGFLGGDVGIYYAFITVYIFSHFVFKDQVEEQSRGAPRNTNVEELAKVNTIYTS